MRKIVFIISLLVFSAWLACCLFLMGYIPTDYLPSQIGSISLPTTSAEMGDSFGIVNGLFSGIAIILALVTVVIQGKELSASTTAQIEQAHALSMQLKYHEVSVQLNALSVRLQYLLSEVSRMDKILSDIEDNFLKKELFNNTVQKKQSLLQESAEIDKEMKIIIDSL